MLKTNSGNEDNLVYATATWDYEIERYISYIWWETIESILTTPDDNED